MKKFIVITSIFYPTQAVKAYAGFEDYRVIVVGDKKTPSDWNCEGVDYLSVEDQRKLSNKLVKVLPYNHYCRKMLGYLLAIKGGAESIIDTDDDNFPNDNWGFPAFEHSYDCIDGRLGFVNVYQLFTKQKIWARGLPLNLINTWFELEKKVTIENCKVGVWQGLADEDPDVDSIYRLTSDARCNFDNREPVVLGKGTISPFNTQNTIISKEVFPLLYLPTTVSFRFTDILRGLVAQPIMWLYDFQLGFITSTVFQERNYHDYMSDFISEIPMFKNCTRIIDIVSDSISKSQNMETNLLNAYTSLHKNKIVGKKEVYTVEAWLNDIKK